MWRIAVTADVVGLLARKRVFTRPHAGGRLQDGDFLGVPADCRLEPYSQIFAGYCMPRFMGAFSYSHSPLTPTTSVGRYASIATGVHWMGPPHPTTWATTSSAFLEGSALQGMAAYRRDIAALATVHPPRPFDLGDMTYEVGPDAWLGDQVMVAPGVKIGAGAIVGARSLVLKDVPPYAIVGGNPAKLIRWRMSEALIERMLAAEWWRFTPADIGDLPMEQPEAFLDQLEDRLPRLKPMTPFLLTGPEIRAAGLEAE